MKKLIESTKRLQGNIDRCISRLIKARQYHDKIEEAGAVLDMERLLVASTQQLQCCIDKLQDCGSVVEWQTGEPKEGGSYLTTLSNGVVWYNVWAEYANEWVHWNDDIVAWFKVSDIKPYKEKKK